MVKGRGPSGRGRTAADSKCVCDTTQCHSLLRAVSVSSRLIQPWGGGRLGVARGPLFLWGEGLQCDPRENFRPGRGSAVGAGGPGDVPSVSGEGASTAWPRPGCGAGVLALWTIVPQEEAICPVQPAHLLQVGKRTGREEGGQDAASGLRGGNTNWPPPGLPEGVDSPSGLVGLISRARFLRLHNGLFRDARKSPEAPSSSPTQEVEMLSWRFLKPLNRGGGGEEPGTHGACRGGPGSQGH